MPFCSSCGKEVSATDSFCWSCGYPLRSTGQTVQPRGMVGTRAPPGPSERKNGLVAVFLSFLVPGLGQYYVGAKRKGELFMVVAVVLALLIFVGVGVYLYTLFWIYNMIDAFLTVRRAIYVQVPV